MRLALLALSLSVACSAADIPQGTHVLLRLVNSISSRTAREGDFVYMRTASPIAADGQIVVPEGSYVQGVVTDCKRSGRVSGKAELGIRIDSLTLPSGKMIRLTPHLSSVDSGGTEQKVDAKENEIKQGGSHEADAVRVGELSGAGAGAGGGVGLATVLLSRGKEVDLRQGSALDVVFDRSVPVE